jgi:hypothetical protein
MRTSNHLSHALLPLVFAATCLLVAGCGLAADEASASNEAAVGEGEAELKSVKAALVFNADHTVSRVGDLRSGQAFTLRYDTLRLAGCRGTYQGVPAFGITAFVKSGDAAPVTYTVAGYGGPQAPNTATSGIATITIAGQPPGELSIWFQESNRFGCMNYDSNLGSNYRFMVDAAPGSVTPDYLGNAAFVTSRATCDGMACESDRISASQSFSFGTWTRQRAAITALYFDAWKAGYTDRENPDLWKQMDAKVLYRTSKTGPFRSMAANIEKRVGNNTRYTVSLKAMDPLGGFPRATKADCPKAPLLASADGQYVEVAVEYYFKVGARELRPSTATSVFNGTFADYRGNFEICLQ